MKPKPTWSPTAHSTVADMDTVSLNSSSGSEPTLIFALSSIIAPLSEILDAHVRALIVMVKDAVPDQWMTGSVAMLIRPLYLWRRSSSSLRK